MVASNSLLDVIAGTLPGVEASVPLDERIRIANELVARTLDEHAHNEAMDSYGPRKQYRRMLARATETAFRRMHKDWLAGAQILLGRVKEMHAAGQSISRLQDLKMAVASTELLLQFSADEAERDIQEISKEISRGARQYQTVEEVRRELRAQAGE
jgi:hypothetical protein